jgi:hypothetical protein
MTIANLCFLMVGGGHSTTGGPLSPPNALTSSASQISQRSVTTGGTSLLWSSSPVFLAQGAIVHAVVSQIMCPCG